MRKLEEVNQIRRSNWATMTGRGVMLIDRVGVPGPFEHSLDNLDRFRILRIFPTAPGEGPRHDVGGRLEFGWRDAASCGRLRVGRGSCRSAFAFFQPHRADLDLEELARNIQSGYQLPGWRRLAMNLKEGDGILRAL